MNIRSTFRLLLKKQKDLTIEERADLARIVRRVSFAFFVLVALALAAGYVAIFSNYRPGPPRDRVVDVMNMFTLSLGAGWLAFRVYRRAFRSHDWTAIPLAAAATTLLVIGAAALPDMAVRLKGDLGRSLVTFKATIPLSTILSEAKKSPDADFDDKLKKVSDDVLEFARTKSQAVDSLLSH